LGQNASRISFTNQNSAAPPAIVYNSSTSATFFPGAALIAGKTYDFTITIDGVESAVSSATFTTNPAAATYTINYLANNSTSGSVPAGQTKTQGVPLTLATNSGIPSLTRTGFTFNGWNTLANGTGTAYAAGTLYSTDAALTLSAAWTPTPAPVGTKLAFTTQPSASGTGGTALTQQPVVTVQDATGATATGYSGTVALAIKSGSGAAGATLSGTVTATVSNGVATFSGLSLDKAGTGYVLTATAGSLTVADSNAIAITVGAAVKLAFVTQPAGAIANTRSSAANVPGRSSCCRQSRARPPCAIAT
jgi:uncharacterized repeat protein (TIGR02543 family)